MTPKQKNPAFLQGWLLLLGSNQGLLPVNRDQVPPRGFHPFSMMSRMVFLDFCFLIKASAVIASDLEGNSIQLFTFQGIPLLVQILFLFASLWKRRRFSTFEVWPI